MPGNVWSVGHPRIAWWPGTGKGGPPTLQDVLTNVGLAVVFALVGGLSGILLVVASTWFLPAIIRRMTPAIDEEKEILRGNAAVGEYPRPRGRGEHRGRQHRDRRGGSSRASSPALHDGAWKLAEVLPEAAAGRLTTRENVDQDFYPAQLEWYYRQTRAL